MTAQNEKDYYLNLKPKLMEDFKETEDYLTKVLDEYLDQSKIAEILKETRSRYESLIPELPYIGGDANFFTASLTGVAWCLPLFKALEREGVSVRDMAKIHYERVERDNESKSPDKKRHLREFYFSPAMRDVEMKRSGESQSGKYPGDFVSKYVEGDGETFDFGIDFIECGVYKFLKLHDATKYLPIFCMTDYATYRAFGIGFKRTRTMANGASFCAFRFKKDWETPRGWPPEDLEEKLPL